MKNLYGYPYCDALRKRNRSLNGGCDGQAHHVLLELQLLSIFGNLPVLFHITLLQHPFNIEAQRIDECLFKLLVFESNQEPNLRLLLVILYKLLRRSRAYRPHILDVLIVRIGFRLWNLRFNMLGAQVCDLLFNLRLKVEEGELGVVVGVLSYFEFTRILLCQLHIKFDHTDYSRVAHVSVWDVLRRLQMLMQLQWQLSSLVEQMLLRCVSHVVTYLL